MKGLLLALLVASVTLGVARAGATEIIITATAIEPRMLRATTGERVNFVNRPSTSTAAED